MADKSKTAKRTLDDSDIATRRGLKRRSFLLGMFGGSTALAACGEVVVSPGTGVGGFTDADTGAITDLSGRGRGPGGSFTGITDADDGSTADSVNFGRGGSGPTQAGGFTDADTGSISDPAGQGRGPGGSFTGITDADDGATTDSVNFGRG